MMDPLPGDQERHRLAEGLSLVRGGSQRPLTVPPVGTEPIARIACPNCMHPVGWLPLCGKEYRHARGSESIGTRAAR